MNYTYHQPIKSFEGISPYEDDTSIYHYKHGEVIRFCNPIAYNLYKNYVVECPEDMVNTLLFTEYSKVPYWTNHCGHPEENYIGSYTAIDVVNKQYVKFKCDLYFVKNYTNIFCFPDICIRTGDEGSDYYSTNLESILINGRKHYQPYQSALEIISCFYSVTLQKFKKE